MSIELIAFRKESGVAYIKMLDNIFLLRPPYTEQSLFNSDRETVIKAVNFFNFSSCEINFEGFESLVAYISNAYIKFYSNEELTIPSSYQILVETAPIELLQNFLDKIIFDIKLGINIEPAYKFLKLLKRSALKNTLSLLEPKITQVEIELLNFQKELLDLRKDTFKRCYKNKKYIAHFNNQLLLTKLLPIGLNH